MNILQARRNPDAQPRLFYLDWIVHKCKHTHYNVVSNDGHVPYTGTRSTGQVEEGPVGYSVTTIDNVALSWCFVEVGDPGLIVITQPEDERLMTHRSSQTEHPKTLTVSVKTWSREPISGSLC
jgi:Icc protein